VFHLCSGMSHYCIADLQIHSTPHVLTFNDQQRHSLAHTLIKIYQRIGHAHAEQHHPRERADYQKQLGHVLQLYRVHNPASCLLIPALLLTFSKVLDTLSDHRMASLNDLTTMTVAVESSWFGRKNGEVRPLTTHSCSNASIVHCFDRAHFGVEHFLLFGRVTS